MALCAGLLVSAAWAAPPGAGGSTTFNLDIPSQSLNDALQALALASGHKLLYSSELVDGKTSPAINGKFTTEEAVKRLLTGTDLKYEITADGLVLIRAMDAPAASGEKVIAKENGDPPKEGGKNSSQEFRADQVDQGGAGQFVTAVGGNTSPPETSQNVELQEIVVTAQKRAERLIDTPQSVSVLSSDQLTQLGATQFRDYANTVPGLDFSTSGAGYTQISMRGVTSGIDVSPTVGIYVDDVPYGSSSAFASGAELAVDVGLFDLDRIELLRGPQGTLYGASTMGGLIKYVTRMPESSRFGVEAQAGVSATGDGGGINYNTAAAVNVPISPGVAALRASGYESHDGGYISNVALSQKAVNRSDTYGGRLDLLLTPANQLTVRLTGFLQNISRQGEGTTDYAYSGSPLYGSLDQHRLFAEPFDQEFRLVSGTVTYGFGPATLTSISSYQTLKTDLQWDLSAHYVPLFEAVGPLERHSDRCVE